MNTQSNVRITIFSGWLLFWGATSLALLFAPHFRPEIGIDQILPSIGSIASIWLPVLSCFAGYWFTHEERLNASQKSLSKEHVLGAIGLSVAYLLFVMILIMWVTYGINYGSPEFRTVQEHLPKGISFREQLDGAVKMSLWISPLATAPVLALTGRTTKGIRPSPPPRRTDPANPQV